jgi:large subunit ribosomal protein L35
MFSAFSALSAVKRGHDIPKKLKIKTHRGAAKRFKRTKNNKFLRGSAFKQHILSSKTRKRKRGLKGTTTVADVDAAKLARMLPYR